MLSPRLIPSLLLKNGRCVKTKQFDSMRDTGMPIKSAKVYDAQGADELLFLDITASREGRETLYDIVEQTAEQCFMPLTVGGGVQSLDGIRLLLSRGADRVAINTAAVENPELIRQAADEFGSSTIVVSIDVRETAPTQYEVFTHGGKTATGKNPLVFAQQMESFGAGEILLTSVDRDGMMHGYDLQLIRKIADALTIPLVANGGVGQLPDFVAGVQEGHASGVAAASIFHFTDQSPIKAKFFMKNQGLNVREPT